MPRRSRRLSVELKPIAVGISEDELANLGSGKLLGNKSSQIYALPTASQDRYDTPKGYRAVIANPRARRLLTQLLNSKNILKVNNLKDSIGLKKQRTIAILGSITALLEGCAMYFSFSALMVFFTILITAFAVLQWCIYLNIKSEIKLKELLLKKD